MGIYRAHIRAPYANRQFLEIKKAKIKYISLDNVIIMYYICYIQGFVFPVRCYLT